MRFEDAIRMSIKSYRDGKKPEETIKVAEKFKYTLEFFDEMEKEMTSPKKGKKKKAEEEVDADRA